MEIILNLVVLYPVCAFIFIFNWKFQPSTVSLNRENMYLFYF